MPVPVLESTVSLAYVLEENTFTLTRLAGHPLAAPLAAEFEDFARAVGLLLSCDEELDRVVRRLEQELDTLTEGEKDRPLYQRYFGTRTRRELERPIVGGRLDAIRAWVPTLQAEGAMELVALSGDLERAVLAADGAVLGQAGGERTIRDFRSAGQREALIDQYNAIRRTAALRLADLREAHPDEDLPADFAEGFFRHDPRGTVDPGAPVAAELRAKVERLEAELDEAREQLGAIAAHEAAQAQLLEAKRLAEETRLRVEALEARRLRGD